MVSKLGAVTDNPIKLNSEINYPQNGTSHCHLLQRYNLALQRHKLIW